MNEPKIDPKELFRKFVTPRTIPLLIVGLIILLFRKELPGWWMKRSLHEVERLMKEGKLP